MNVGELLRECAYRIAQPGAWLQNRWWDDNDPKSFCALGVIEAVDRYEVVRYSAIKRAINKILFNEESENGFRIIEWNNDPKRTQDEVVEAFIKAADLWEKEHQEITLDKEELTLVG